MPKRDAERILLNDDFCSRSKNDMKGERLVVVILFCVMFL